MILLAFWATWPGWVKLLWGFACVALFVGSFAMEGGS